MGLQRVSQNWTALTFITGEVHWLLISITKHPQNLAATKNKHLFSKNFCGAGISKCIIYMVYDIGPVRRPQSGVGRACSISGFNSEDPTPGLHAWLLVTPSSLSTGLPLHSSWLLSEGNDPEEMRGRTWEGSQVLLITQAWKWYVFHSLLMASFPFIKSKSVTAANTENKGNAQRCGYEKVRAIGDHLVANHT